MALIALGACGGGGGPIVVDANNTPRVVSVQVSPKTLSMQAGQTQSLMATVAVEHSASQSVSWVSSDPARLTVNPSGLSATITAVSAGTVTVTATSVADASKSDFATITISPSPIASVTIAPNDTETTVGRTVALRVTARDAAGNELTGRAFTFSSSNATVASVSTAGVVATISLGIATVTATAEGKSATATIRVRAPNLAEALALRTAAIERFGAVTSAGESVFLLGGLLADEFQSADAAAQRNEIDRRSVSSSNALVVAAYTDLHAARLAAQQAREALIANAASLPDTARWSVNQMYMFQGYIEVLLGEHFCNGIPFSDFDPQSPTLRFGMPETVAQVFARAAQSFTDALQYRQLTTATDAAAIEMQHLALVGRARAKLDGGDYGGAGADASTSLQLQRKTTVAFRHGAGVPANAIWRFNNNERRYTVAERDGGAGLNFVSAQDLRLPITSSPLDIGVDGTTRLVLQQLWPSATSSIALASDAEAYLIVAEQRVRTGDLAAAVFAINNARTAAGLFPVASPGTSQATADLVFRERGFFLWGTGHRLGDLRRLVRAYGRADNTVFPTGAFAKGGTYGTDLNLPISQVDQNPNPNYRGCSDRQP